LGYTEAIYEVLAEPTVTDETNLVPLPLFADIVFDDVKFSADEYIAEDIVDGNRDLRTGQPVEVPEDQRGLVGLSTSQDMSYRWTKYVLVAERNKVWMFDAHLALVSSFGVALDIEGITGDSAGSIYLSLSDDSISKFDTKGVLDTSFGEQGTLKIVTSRGQLKPGPLHYFVSVYTTFRTTKGERALAVFDRASGKTINNILGTLDEIETTLGNSKSPAPAPMRNVPHFGKGALHPDDWTTATRAHDVPYPPPPPPCLKRRIHHTFRMRIPGCQLFMCGLQRRRAFRTVVEQTDLNPPNSRSRAA
jgi:hypothetical protein